MDGALRRQALQARLVLQIHDEPFVECPPWEAELVMQIVTEEMAGLWSWPSPLGPRPRWARRGMRQK